MDEQELANEKDTRKWFSMYFKRFYIEIIIMIVLTLALINYFVGMMMNKSHAYAWLS
jgi:hypothetical protein